MRAPASPVARVVTPRTVRVPSVIGALSMRARDSLQRVLEPARALQHKPASVYPVHRSIVSGEILQLAAKVRKTR